MAGLTQQESPAGGLPFSRWYVRILGAAFVLQGLLGGVYKVAQGRSDDLVHNGLHLASGLVALMMARSTAGGRRFARWFGALYLSLGGVGWVWWTNPFGVLPLGPGDHIFHLAVGGGTLVVSLLPRPTEVKA